MHRGYRSLHISANKKVHVSKGRALYCCALGFICGIPNMLALGS